MRKKRLLAWSLSLNPKSIQFLPDCNRFLSAAAMVLR